MDTIIILCAKYLIWAVVAGGALFWLISKDKLRLGIEALLAMTLAYALAKLGAHFWYDPRPFVAGNFTPLIPHAADNGFPSDHMLLGAAIASIIYARDRMWGLALWIVALIVGLARVFAGVHHVADLAGSILAAVLAVLVVRFVARLIFKERDYSPSIQ